MQKRTVENAEVISVAVAIVGSGAAGLNAASELYSNGVEDVLLITEGMKCGTSRNTGSDKQTYYKLTLSGSESDSVRAMADDLFKGKAVDGDIALSEAALSSRCFFSLVNKGVPFPHNAWGEYIGYKTDHDPHMRATSAGPYTSRFMTEALEKTVKSNGTAILDGVQIVKIVVRDGKAVALIGIRREDGTLLAIEADKIILATGGPASLYAMSVYPESQFGSSGVALEAGAMGKNLTEWQFGLASLKPRWNVSGSYMQVLPRIVSVEEDGTEHDFLFEFFNDEYQALSLEFLKGYQWPFDIRKLEKGSSIVDVLSFLEIEKGRRVYLDFIHNPGLRNTLEFEKLSDEAYTYLKNASSLQDTPVARLRAMNDPAYAFYLAHGVDLEKEYLEIGLSAQHNNGGLAIDSWWQSNLENLFPVGEVAASHGVYRPGGSALNAGQVGSLKASLYISQKGATAPDMVSGIEKELEEVSRIITASRNGKKDLDEEFASFRLMMSLSASVIRRSDDMEKALSSVNERLSSFAEVKVDRVSRLWYLFEYRNALLTARSYLSAMIDYAKNVGLSRGSALYTRADGAVHPAGLDERFIYSLEGEEESLVQEIDKNLKVAYRKVRPMPEENNFFEKVWAEYRKNRFVE
jgi:Succinate dehydrogenase/fumarate reductase, flavoprotein subunit